jgi:sec-independent protein translocase protein TatC
VPAPRRLRRRKAAQRPRLPDGRMSLIDHLRELRNRLGICALAIVASMVVVWFLWVPLFDFLKQPYCDTGAGALADCQLFAISVFDQLRVRLRVAAIGGIVIAAPVWLYQIGAFITPALHRQERKYAAGFLGASLVLFAIGTTFAYLTISQGLDFLLRIGGEDITTITSVHAYLNFVTLVLLAFGFAFQFPVVVTFLNLMGVFPVATMKRWRRGMYVAIFFASAVITPSQDPITFMVMAIPVCGLYELCILIARARERAARRRRAADPVLGLDDDATSPLETAPSELPDLAGGATTGAGRSDVDRST